MKESVSISQLFAAMRSENADEQESAQREFSHRYFMRLSRWARKRLQPALRSIVCEDGVANSVCRTVIRRVNDVPQFEGYFLKNPEGALRHILITKLYDIGVLHLERKCRDARRTMCGSESTECDSHSKIEPTDIAELELFDPVWQDMLRALQRQLDQTNARIVELLIEGQSKEEIGRILGMTGNGVRNRIKRDIRPVASKYWPEWSTHSARP